MVVQNCEGCVTACHVGLKREELQPLNSEVSEVRCVSDPVPDSNLSASLIALSPAFP